MAEKTGLYVLTGFLGSGKTTILSRLLVELKEKKIGIIQNEFGKISVDGEILRDDDIKMVEINRGSIFCSCLRLSFVSALAEMAKFQFDYLFVESSGWGDPSNVLEILDAATVLCGDRYELKGVICLVDAVNFLDQLEDKETVSRQLKHCHLAILSKQDLVDERTLLAVEQKIREINPMCEILYSANADLELSFLREDLMQYQWAESEDTTNSEEDKPKTLFMDLSDDVDRKELEAFLTEISGDLYRAKGFCRIAGEGWRQVDLVGSRIDIRECSQKEQAQIVFISKIGPAVIKKMIPAWERLVSVPMKLRN